MIELIGTFVTIVAVIGAWLNNRHKIECFYLWILSNALSAAIHWHTETYSLVGRDLIFLALAIEGIWRWKRTKRQPARFNAYTSDVLIGVARRTFREGDLVFENDFEKILSNEGNSK